MWQNNALWLVPDAFGISLFCQTGCGHARPTCVLCVLGYPWSELVGCTGCKGWGPLLVHHQSTQKTLFSLPKPASLQRSAVNFGGTHRVKFKGWPRPLSVEELLSNGLFQQLHELASDLTLRCLTLAMKSRGEPSPSSLRRGRCWQSKNNTRRLLNHSLRLRARLAD